MTDDPNAAVLEYFHARRLTLLDEIIRRHAALEEVDAAITKLTDGRSTVNRRRKTGVDLLNESDAREQRKARTAGNSSAADGQGPLPDPMRAEDAA